MNEEDDIFLEQMRGVSPIKKSNRLKKENSKNITKGPKQTKTNKAKTGPTKPTKAVNKSEFILEKINIKKGIKKRSFYIDKKDDVKSLKKKTQNLEYNAFSEAIIKLFR